MILALDVHYEADRAKVAGIGFQHWADAEPAQEYTYWHSPIAPYESGAFYKRELPCLLGLIHTLAEPLDYVVVDDPLHGPELHRWNYAEDANGP